ncbi:GNAT family N-acetyltransferase [Acinetobacter sp. LoGeW2-3]|uniref:GNAT family N-acetyltransferase n=1 Tax=Acinetobacter sp. LoGeW2-3 TaxID=1808001 RepID=UPI000C05A7BA|nr:GNAT family protein [Acinetobacter sp. LoGeW2-3]ATO19838.1 GNAT family N-acetyltransferase [Acinetobacter sp. LoGeW2-3]
MKMPVLESNIYQLRLEPLTWEHYADLEAACAEGDLGEDLYNSVPYLSKLKPYVQQALDQQVQGSRMAFAVIDLISGRAIGTTSYHDIKPEIPRFYIGYTWYAKRYQRTYVNRVCKYLLLSHAFEQLDAQVVGFRTDHLNLRSQKAIEALGAKRDGIIRCHMLRKDGQTVRDSYIYSILKSEWADVKSQLQSKLMQYSNKQFEI